MPLKQNRWKRWLLLALTLAGILFIGIPTGTALRARYQISSAMHSASSIRLEETSSGKILFVQKLAHAEFSEVTEAIPFTLDIGIPGLMAFCFIPHHRIIFTDAAQHETALEVCFTCNQMCFSGGDIRFIPFAWRESLRQLFLQHKMPVRESYPESP